ncbi:AEC family transporter [Phenylobacterium sp.]|uniref:AEC family transporter n=1 Tax=Phenylobacterium sp. TaxID=1871053 RepID=UPI0027357C5F|nr:AEC family transporter [Phenylobacterium sp.]MDP3659096.1 AEC family transporter [Phenylobacterium sp.]
MNLLQAAAPLLIPIVVGMILGRLGWLGDTGVRRLVAFTYWIGFPLMLLHGLGHSAPPDPSLGMALGAYAVCMCSILGVAILIARAMGFDAQVRAGMPMAASMGNTGFFGVPLAVSLFGEAQRGPATALLTADFVILLTLAVATLQSARPGGSIPRLIARVLFNPTVAGGVVGLWLSLGHIELPRAIDLPLSWIAVGASPVALLALGGLMGREPVIPRSGEFAPLALTLALKLVAAPLLTWTLLGLLGLRPDLRATATLLAACPTAVNVFIQTRSLDVFARGASQAVILGTAASALTLPLIVWLISF